MRCQFSETQFSFCFTFEFLKTLYPFIAFPIFPNTVVEGRDDGGYDVEISNNLFFQFKIPTYFNRLTARNMEYWKVFKGTYFKIAVNTDLRQFELLKQLKKPHNQVYYATPPFHTIEELKKLYLNNNIVQNSALFSIDEFPAYRSGYHNLIYNDYYNWAKLFSEPVEIKKSKFNSLQQLLSQNKINTSLSNTANEIEKTLNKLGYEVEELDYEKIFTQRQFDFKNIQKIHSILLTQFNIHWYPILSK